MKKKWENIFGLPLQFDYIHSFGDYLLLFDAAIRLECVCTESDCRIFRILYFHFEIRVTQCKYALSNSI